VDEGGERKAYSVSSKIEISAAKRWVALPGHSAGTAPLREKRAHDPFDKLRITPAIGIGSFKDVTPNVVEG
jgi:hypothetical protein